MKRGYFVHDGLMLRAGNAKQKSHRRLESASFLSTMVSATVAIFKGGGSGWTRHGPARFSAEHWQSSSSHSGSVAGRKEGPASRRQTSNNTSPLPPRVPPPCSTLSALSAVDHAQPRKDRKRKPSKQQNTIEHLDPAKKRPTSPRLRGPFSYLHIPRHNENNDNK